jgi:hypothetical protein
MTKYYRRHPVKWCKFRVGRPVRKFVDRGRRGWSREDVWSFDSYLARVIGEGVEALRSGGAYPGDMTPEEWDAILERMSKGFLAYADDQFRWGDKEAQDAAYAGVQESLKLFKKHFSGLWD